MKRSHLVALAMLAPVLGLPLSAPHARPTTAAAEDDVALGRAIAERDCSGCHAIGPAGDSPFEGAPRWRDLTRRFDPEALSESLAEGISVGHEAMPQRAYEPDEVRALVAYMKSLKP